jgi:hypothetical protein
MMLSVSYISRDEVDEENDDIFNVKNCSQFRLTESFLIKSVMPHERVAMPSVMMISTSKPVIL